MFDSLATPDCTEVECHDLYSFSVGRCQATRSKDLPIPHVLCSLTRVDPEDGLCLCPPADRACHSTAFVLCRPARLICGHSTGRRCVPDICCAAVPIRPSDSSNETPSCSRERWQSHRHHWTHLDGGSAALPGVPVPTAAEPAKAAAAEGATSINLTLDIEGVHVGLDNLAINLTGLRVSIDKLKLTADVSPIFNSTSIELASLGSHAQHESAYVTCKTRASRLVSIA